MRGSISLCVCAALLAGLLWPVPARADAEPVAVSQDEGPDLPVVVMLIGAGARLRNIHIVVGDGSERSFETGVYFDFGWHLFVRPMSRRSPRAAMQAIVFQIDGGSGIGLKAQAQAGIELQTNTWRMLGQFGYLYPIKRLQIGGLAGVGGDVFSIDLNSVLPSSRIIYARLGPAVSYQILPGFLGFRADFGLRFPFYYGEIEDAFGQDGSGIGLDGALTFEGRLEAGFSYGVRFVWEYYRLRFSGPTMNVPAMGDGAKDRDHALTIQLLFGWSL